MAEPLLRARAINKNFGAVVALQDVSMELPKGEITGLVGDNGAGKSTLIKIISGVLSPDAGSIEFDGARANFASPAEARAQGVETVYQDLALVGNLPVWGNVYLGRELIQGPKFLHVLDKGAMLANTRDMLRRFIRRSTNRWNCCRAARGRWWRSHAPARGARNSSSWTSRPRRSASPRPRRSKR